MAEPKFTSQQSEILLNVGEDHLSATSSPQAAEPHAQTHVEKSPSVQASSDEVIILESAEPAERIEDSYQESLRHPVPAPLTGDEDEEDLYGVSPSGKAQLDTAIAAIKSTQEEQPAMPPARNPIDALLDDGATAAPNALDTSAEKEDKAPEHISSSPAHDYAALDAKLKNIDAQASKAPTKPTRSRKRSPGNSDFEPDDSDRNDDGDGAQDLHEQQPVKKATRVKSKASDQKRPNASLKAEDGSELTVHAVKTAVEDKTRGAGKSTIAQEAHETEGKKASRVGTKPAPVASRAKAKATPQLASLSQPLVAEPSGRPVRKAKKTALGKLKAKRGKENDDTLSGTDDESEDNASSFGAKDDKAHVTGRRKTKAHLPTPVTKSNTSKRDGTSNPSGKLQSVKSKALPTTASVKKASGDTSRPSDTTTNPRTRRDTSLIGEGSVLKSTEIEFDAPENKSHRKTSASAKDDERNKNGGKSPARRPGALKKPARSASRGRVPLREIRYDFPGSTPRVKRNKRSVSRASRASVKPGATRQRMQSESVKHQDDSDVDNSRQLSVSHRAASKEIELGSPPRKKPMAQGQSKELPPRPQPNRGNNSTLNSNIAGKQKNATGVQSTISRQKPGSSQGNAIMIEHASQSSSSPSPSPDPDKMARPNATGQIKHRQEPRTLQTPVVMPSSPPAGGSEILDTPARDKPTIIAFSKKGPRNQGIASSSKDPGSDVAPIAPSTRGAADVNTSVLRDQSKGKDIARTLFPSQDHALVTMDPSNVSVIGDDPFADFTKNGKNKALTSLLQRATAAAPKSIRRKSEPEQKRDEDDGFFMIDDFDDMTLVNDHGLALKPDVQRTASQIAMPPPNGPEKIVKKVIVHKSLLDNPIKIGTKPTIAKTAPEPPRLKKAVLATTTKVVVEPKLAKQASKVESKTVAKSASLQKATETITLHDAAEARSTKEAFTEQKAQPKRKRELSEVQSDSPQKKTKTLQTKPPVTSSSDGASARQLRSSRIPQGAKVVITDPAERPDRRRTRPTHRTTQGSQGVDILGSPYPKELEVPIQTTALEIFSQQANLSSDQMVSSDAVVPCGLAGRLNLAAVPRILPPTHRKPMSSNGKPLPAAPNESSKAATRIASGPLAEQLITAKHEQSVMEDPFTTSSHKRVPPVKQTGQEADFKQVLRKHGIIIDQQKRTTNHDEEEEEEDPDKTLVNPADDDLESDDPRDLVGTSPAKSNEPSNASTVSAAQKALENVGDWRNTLRPHQTHLFDSLVIASHKLVRHMVDSETAHRDIVADYRRQGEIVVTELERAHSREFEQYAAGMQELKKRAADGLASHGKRLKQDVRDAERLRVERREQARISRDGFDDMLDELLSTAGLA
ncbi:hypothetical protein Q7P36_009450 [Cladosporium allicinum]